MSNNLRKIALAIILAMGLALAFVVQGQAADKYPSKPINMIVPYAPASGADLGSKVMADRMAEFLGQPMVSVYKPGGGGSLGAAFVAKAKPDGYTVLVGSVSPIVISPIVKKLDYTTDDFIIAGTYSKIPLWLVVKKDARWKDLKEFVDEAKKNPGKFNLSTFGKLTAVDFLLELLNKHAGIKLVNVPYKSSGEALTAMLGGHAEGAMVSGASGHLEAGTVRILAVAEEKKLEDLPDVPTFKEFGYPIVLDSPYSFCFPKGTPRAVVEPFFGAQKKAYEKYGKEIKTGLRRVEQWVEFRTIDDAQKRYREAAQTYLQVAKELGVEAK
ncbi:MAG TPA: tripartite tricarboxylate transporter substrate binding protein [Thermodesulfobacteriota bacterium]|nr:tripartite tricarboxylate transporter substrate binding protein [Thermodesulfobacteriota bacterium]